MNEEEEKSKSTPLEKIGALAVLALIFSVYTGSIEAGVRGVFELLIAFVLFAIPATIIIRIIEWIGSRF